MAEESINSLARMDKCGSAKSAEEWEIIDEHINGSITVWPDGYNIFRYLATYKSSKLPKIDKKNSKLAKI